MMKGSSLYPVPPITDDKLHLFVSLGHVQMMTEAMKPLGISVLRTLIPAGKSSPQAESDLLLEAGSRLYANVRKMRDNFYLIGDLTSEATPQRPPLAPRVNIAAAKQADTVLSYFLNRA